MRWRIGGWRNYEKCRLSKLTAGALGKSSNLRNRTCLEQTPSHKNATHGSVACIRLWMVSKMTSVHPRSRAPELSAADGVFERVRGSQLERFDFQQHFSVAVTLQFRNGETNKKTTPEYKTWNEIMQIGFFHLSIMWREEGSTLYEDWWGNNDVTVRQCLHWNNSFFYVLGKVTPYLREGQLH